MGEVLNLYVVNVGFGLLGIIFELDEEKWDELF